MLGGSDGGARVLQPCGHIAITRHCEVRGLFLVWPETTALTWSIGLEVSPFLPFLRKVLSTTPGFWISFLTFDLGQQERHFILLVLGGVSSRGVQNPFRSMVSLSTGRISFH